MILNQTRKPLSKRKIILIVVIIIFVAPVLIQLYIWSAPPSPAIRYGEFPFRLEYELNGERFIIEDTLIATFIGRRRGGIMEESGLRMWYSTLENRILEPGRGFNSVLVFGDDLSIFFIRDLLNFTWETRLEGIDLGETQILGITLGLL